MQSTATITAKLSLAPKDQGCLDFKVTHPDSDVDMVFEFLFANNELHPWVTYARKNAKVGIIHSLSNNVHADWQLGCVVFEMVSHDNGRTIMKCNLPRAQVEEALRLELIDAMSHGRIVFSLNDH